MGDRKPRESLDSYFVRMAYLVSSRSTCIRRRVGSVVTVNKKVVSTGYNGAPRGVDHCTEKGVCRKDELGCASGHGDEACMACHSEASAIAQAASTGAATEGGTIYCTHKPCPYCAKMLVNAGIRRVVYSEDYPSGGITESVFAQAGVEVTRFTPDAEE